MQRSPIVCTIVHFLRSRVPQWHRCLPLLHPLAHYGSFTPPQLHNTTHRLEVGVQKLKESGEQVSTLQLALQREQVTVQVQASTRYPMYFLYSALNVLPMPSLPHLQA